MATAVKHTSVVQVERPDTYRCVSCGHTASVMVESSAYASAHSSALLGSAEDAQAEARKRAEIAALANVKTMLGMVPCPVCGKRDPVWVRRFYMDHGIKIGGMVFAAGLACFIILSQISVQVFLGGWAVVSLIVVGLYLWVMDLGFEWNKASKRVHFLPGAPPAGKG